MSAFNKEIGALAKDAAEADQFPAFPRTLSKADRGTLADGAAHKWAASIKADAVAAGVKMTATEAMLLEVIAGLTIHGRWMAERIEALEDRHD